MKTILKALDKNFEEYCCAVMLGYIAISLNIEVVARYIFTAPSAYTDEIARILMTSIVFLGTSLAIKQDRHVIIEVLPKLSLKNSFIINILSNIIFIIFCIIFIVVTMRAISFHKMLSTTTAGLGLPYWVVLSILPFSFFLSIFRLLQKIYRLVSDYKKQ